MTAIVRVGRRAGMSVAVAACIWVTAGAAQVSVTYEEFIKKPPAEQMAVFRGLSPEARVLLKRTHAERWLQSHRDSLSAEQTEVVREAIAFLTPQLYSGVPSAETRTQEEAIRRRLECGLGRTRATEAFAFVPQPTLPPRQSVGDTVDEWLAWFVDCGGRRM